ncbi:MAG: hypothetical protein KatS3mg005_3745 [Bryobacteraceae bacterium]|nr:MAG: hypothetical protein KatS3mg005_3745 [Bryobacteraceae bacterium]
MLLPKEFVSYLCRQVTARIGSNFLEVIDAGAVSGLMESIFLEELAVEDKLNEEVRNLLEEYSVYMANNGISYTEMFRRIKNQLIQQRKIVRASGRETGDGMKLSRDKITEISHKLVNALRRSRSCRLKKNPNDVRLELVRLITDILQVEERADRQARDKIRSHKRDIIEGTEEWKLLLERYYSEALKSHGIDLGRS